MGKQAVHFCMACFIFTEIWQNFKKRLQKNHDKFFFLFGKECVMIDLYKYKLRKTFMVNTRKVRLMTKLAIYEKKEGKEDIKLGKYYRRDFVRMKLLQNLIAVTIGYLLVLAMLVAYHMEYLIREAVNLDYIGIGKAILGVYIIVVTIYLMAAMMGYSFYYNYSRRKLAKYFRMLRKLRSMYQEENDTGEMED